MTVTLPHTEPASTAAPSSVESSATDVDQPIQPAQPQRKSHVGYQWFMLLGAMAVLAAAALLRLEPGGKVEMPGAGGLPALCMWKSTVGINCPGCGLTRAFVAIAHGQWTAAWKFNGASPFIFALVVYQVPFRIVQIWRMRGGKREFAHSPMLIALLAWGAVAALLAQWAWRMM
jgi:hypothetical protein